MPLQEYVVQKKKIIQSKWRADNNKIILEYVKKAHTNRKKKNRKNRKNLQQSPEIH